MANTSPATLFEDQLRHKLQSAGHSASLCAGGPRSPQGAYAPISGPHCEHYVNRLSHFAQATRQGCAERHRFTTLTDGPDSQQSPPTSHRQLQSAGRGAPLCARGPHAPQGAYAPISGPRCEHYVNRLSHFAQATRQGCAERHRFAANPRCPSTLGIGSHFLPHRTASYRARAAAHPSAPAARTPHKAQSAPYKSPG